MLHYRFKKKLVNPWKLKYDVIIIMLPFMIGYLKDGWKSFVRYNVTSVKQDFVRRFLSNFTRSG